MRIIHVLKLNYEIISVLIILISCRVFIFSESDTKEVVRFNNPQKKITRGET